MLRVARFTLWQAGLSTLLSVVPRTLRGARGWRATPRFPGRSMILRLFGVPLALPSLVAALGILALYGRAGYFAQPLGLFHGGQWPGIYGLSGILVAHVFFNMPLATRLFLHALETIPADQWRLSAQLGMNARATFRLLEWPVLRASLAGVAALVFMLCITSFTIVLLLGGGPRATTLEVAIYQALRFDFDPARAVALVALQLSLVATSVFLIARLGADVTADRGPARGTIASAAGPTDREGHQYRAHRGGPGFRGRTDGRDRGRWPAGGSGKACHRSRCPRRHIDQPVARSPGRHSPRWRSPSAW